MSEYNEAESITTLAMQAAEPTELNAATIYTLLNRDGGVEIHDTDSYAQHPRRVLAARRVNDAESFVKYLSAHGLPQTEVFADTATSTVLAVIDSHEGASLPAGWQSHILELRLVHTKAWLAWTEKDNGWFTQQEFAEFIEQRATDVIAPPAGDLMSLAQSLYMTKGVEYESATRLSDGQTNLVYKEKVTTRGLGKIEVPKELMLALQPYVGGPRQYAHANFRTRLNGSELRIGYVLVRPEEILEGVFADIVTEIRTGRKESTGKSAFLGIPHPIYFGRP